MAHSHHLHREHQVSHRRVSHILKGEPDGAMAHNKSHAFSKVTSKTGAEHHDAFVAGSSQPKRYARGGKVKKGHHQTNIAIVVPHSGAGAAAGGAGPIPGPGAPPPGGAPPMMAKPPMAGPPGAPPGMPPPPMRKHGGRIGRADGGCAKAGGGAIDGESTKANIRKWGKEASKNSYAKGGFVKPNVIDRGGASTGVGRLEAAEHMKRKKK